jgi:tetratricopeptide (TPR) repeat protein
MISVPLAMYDQPPADKLQDDASPEDASQTNAPQRVEETQARSVGERPYWPIGPGATARRLYNQQRYSEALELLDEGFANPQIDLATATLYGRIAASALDDQRIAAWGSKRSDSWAASPDYWVAIGIQCLNQQRFREAVRCFAESLKRDTTDLQAISLIRQALIALGEDELAHSWNQHWRANREVLRVSNRISAADQPDPELFGNLSDRLLALNRPLEAVLWKTIQASQLHLGQDVFKQLNSQHQQIVSSESGFPSVQQRLCGMQIDDYPLPDLGQLFPRRNPPTPGLQPEQPPSSVGTIASQPDLVPIAFANVANQRGLKQVYEFADSQRTDGFAIYEIMGSAIACLDFDLDGWCDVYFGQGGTEPPVVSGGGQNQLFRQVDHAFVDLSQPSGSALQDFTTGVAVGDWNQDGFPDLALAILGNDQLLINQGDGTFRSTELNRNDDPWHLPASMAMGDINGDSLPDLFQVGYVEGEDLARRPERESNGQVVEALSPHQYRAAEDRVWINGGDGTFQQQELPATNGSYKTGLGVLLGPLSEPGINQVFVGNDQHQNHLWQWDPAEESGESHPWIESATLLGCGFSYTGAGTASMGLAAADFDRNGLLDIHVANYQDEASSLFMQKSGSFRDRIVAAGMDAESRLVLGFGCQPIDADNDGWVDIAVTNGHVENLNQVGQPFKQPPQLFRNLAGQFRLSDVGDPSGYWEGRYVGRAMATADIDRNGKLDLLISHLDVPVALLENNTMSPNHWVQFSLVGTTAERSAIGTRVTIHGGNAEQTHVLLGGDGFLSSNQRMIHAGLGTRKLIDRVEVFWPSGQREVFTGLASDRHYQIIQGQAIQTLPSAN